MHDAIEPRADGVENAGLGDVAFLEREARVVLELRDVLDAAHREVVDPDDLPVVLQQPLEQIGAEKPGYPGDQGSLLLR